MTTVTVACCLKVVVWDHREMIVRHRLDHPGHDKRNGKMKLSAWKYVKNNKQVCAVLISALSLSFMTMYVIYVLLQTTVESFRPIMLELPKKISYASITGSSYGLDVNGYETYEELEAAYDEKQDQTAVLFLRAAK